MLGEAVGSLAHQTTSPGTTKNEPAWVTFNQRYAGAFGQTFRDVHRDAH